MELKLMTYLYGGGVIMGSNRTFMELKHIPDTVLDTTTLSSNRTFMELKHSLLRDTYH